MGEDIKSDLAGIAITHPFFAAMVTNALNYIEELEKENKELKEDNEQLDAIKNEAVRRYNFETVPIATIEEKIQELYEEIENCERRQNEVIALGGDDLHIREEIWDIEEKIHLLKQTLEGVAVLQELQKIGG